MEAIVCRKEINYCGTSIAPDTIIVDGHICPAMNLVLPIITNGSVTFDLVESYNSTTCKRCGKMHLFDADFCSPRCESLHKLNKV